MEVIFKISSRNTQLKAIKGYDLLGVNNNYPFSKSKKWIDYLIKGSNIALYPEGKPSQVLKKPKNGSLEIFKALKKAKINYKILPVSIYSEKNIFYLFVNDLITPNKNILVNEIIQSIASALPINLRGKHS